MYNEPKYDNDLVNLGYLKNYIPKEISKSTKNYGKNYSVPPNPPYYLNDTLMIDGKIYVCVCERLKGTFDWNDWKLTATDDSKVEEVEAIISSYELPVSEQIDGKIESFYQTNDPSQDWTDDIERAKHNGDLWRCGRLDYIYKKQNTNPITYKWERYVLPATLFNTSTGHKNIFTEEPVNYSKSDYWFLNNVENPPQDAEVGDLLIANQNSEVYEKTHWIRNEIKVLRVTAPEDTYYMKEEVNEIKANIDETTTSQIRQSHDSISQEVSKQKTLIDSLGETISSIQRTFQEQTDSAITTWFQSSGIQGTLDDLKKAIDSNDDDIEIFKSYITQSVLEDGTPFLELGKIENQTKIRILPERIQFLTNGEETAYISNNSLYINESTILTKQQIGHWVTTEDEVGNLNTYWVEGV